MIIIANPRSLRYNIEKCKEKEYADLSCLWQAFYLWRKVRVL